MDAESLSLETVFPGSSMTDLQLRAAHAVGYADDGTRHFVSKVVDHVEQITGVVEPICWSGISIYV